MKGSIFQKGFTILLFILLFIVVSLCGYTVYRQMLSPCEECPEEVQEESQEEEAEGSQQDTCDGIEVEAESGDVYITLAAGGDRVLVNADEYKSDPDDFEEGWTFMNPRIFSDCKYVLMTQRYNFTTGGGFEEYAFAYDIESETMTKIGDEYFISPSGQHAAVADYADISTDTASISRLSESAVPQKILLKVGSVEYANSNLVGSRLYRIIVTDSGYIYATAHSDEDLVDGSYASYALLEVSPDEKVSVVREFDIDEDGYISYSAYDPLSQEAFFGDCLSNREGLQCENGWVFDVK